MKQPIRPKGTVIRMRWAAEEGDRLAGLPELTNDALDVARWNPEVGCLLDRVYPGRPLIISFGFIDWECMPLFDFFGRSKKLEKQFQVRFNRLLLRDPANAWYHRGVPGLGSHVDAVAARLRGLIRSIRPSRVMAIGQSMGGYGAIMFGMLLGVDRIIAFGPLSHLDPSESVRYGDLRFLRVLEDLQANRPASAYFDLSQLAEALDYQGDLHVIFGTHPGIQDDRASNLDAVHALRLARRSNVVLTPYPEAEHAIVSWLVDHKRIDRELSRLIMPESPPAGEDCAGDSGAAESDRATLVNAEVTSG